MENAQAWLKAHWKPVLAVVLAVVAVWFLFLRKSSGTKATALTIPNAATTGASSGGSLGTTDSSTSTSPTPIAAVGKWFQTILGYQGAAVANLFKAPGDTGIAKQVTSGSDLQVIGPAVPVSYAGYPDLTSMTPVLYQGQQFWAFTSELIGGVTGSAPAAPAAPAATAAPKMAGAGGNPLRGSGFRGGDVYPAFTGQTGALGTARQARASGLPAAPLGTPMQPKQPTEIDVRRAPRRLTDIAQLSRTTDAIPLPQSFSVVIRQTNPDQASSIFTAPRRFRGGRT
jgi:hypothetical protein